MKVGDIVTISNVNKKSIVQSEIFKHSQQDEEVRVETIWREGKFRILLSSKWEIQTLIDTIEGQYELETEDYESCSLIETHDTQSIEISDKKFLSQGDLYEAGYHCSRDYYIIYNGVTLMGILH
tara:strand:+ start:431 stop:802 length:372 start_codon:yes stop_codon:yes gene_type:complete